MQNWTRTSFIRNVGLILFAYASMHMRSVLNFVLKKCLYFTAERALALETMELIQKIEALSE